MQQLTQRPNPKCPKCKRYAKFHALQVQCVCGCIITTSDGEVVSHSTPPKGKNRVPAPSKVPVAEVVKKGVEQFSQPLPAQPFLLQFFSYAHLPPTLKVVSKPFFELAVIVAMGPQNAETTTALRKLLEAKDCAVRAVLAR